MKSELAAEREVQETHKKNIDDLSRQLKEKEDETASEQNARATETKKMRKEHEKKLGKKTDWIKTLEKDVENDIRLNNQKKAIRQLNTSVKKLKKEMVTTNDKIGTLPTIAERDDLRRKARDRKYQSCAAA